MKRKGRRYTGNQTCAGKVRFRDQREAKRRLQRITTHTEKRATTPARAYECHWCKGWHLTSQQGAA